MHQGGVVDSTTTVLSRRRIALQTATNDSQVLDRPAFNRKLPYVAELELARRCSMELRRVEVVKADRGVNEKAILSVTLQRVYLNAS